MLIVHVEDDPGGQELISRMLDKNEYEVETFGNAIAALDYITNIEPDVILVDYRLGEGPNGLMLATHVRQMYPSCVIIIISMFADFDKAVEAMRIGADDFIKKPIVGKELTQRIWEAVMKRRSWFPRSEPVQELSGLVLNKFKRTATWHGEPLKFTAAEFQLMIMLTSKPEHVLPFSDLYAAAKGQRLPSEEARNLLKPHVRNLRAKLGDEGAKRIVNVRGQGYKWQTSDEDGPTNVDDD